jgi:hypothetical protein
MRVHYLPTVIKLLELHDVPHKAWTSPGQMLRLTLLRTRPPGKLLQIWSTSRIDRSLLGPAFVLVDIVFGDQVYRDES